MCRLLSDLSERGWRWPLRVSVHHWRCPGVGGLHDGRNHGPNSQPVPNAHRPLTPLDAGSWLNGKLVAKPLLPAPTGLPCPVTPEWWPEMAALSAGRHRTLQVRQFRGLSGRTDAPRLPLGHCGPPCEDGDGHLSSTVLSRPGLGPYVPPEACRCQR